MQLELMHVLDGFRQRSPRVVVLTGAGISAESGIPTFRGTDGYWVVGSKNYMPEEMATRRMFSIHPEQVWHWYLYRFGACRHAEPNLAHLALVELEAALRDRFTLVTQNIDGLHRRAGSSVERTYCIHGDAAYVRCVNDCGIGLQPLPSVDAPSIDAELSLEQCERLKCQNCRDWLRPHVLWFDEYYDEENYRADSAIRAAAQADLLIVVGTSGATNLPMQIGALCLRQGAAIVDLNPQANPFAIIAERAEHGCAIRGKASDNLPAIVKYLLNDNP
jgi:NAD-dependent deacetylase